MAAPLPPVPQLTQAGFTDPVWARWLLLLRANIVEAVLSLQIATANGFSGSVVGSNPATVTLSVTVAGLLKGSAGAIVAATPGTDYVASVSVTAPITNTGTAANPNIGHAASGVGAGTYGSTTTIPQITVNATGHITAVNNVTVTASAIPSGTTGARPTIGVVVGFVYFDTTLVQPIWVSSTGPIVWVNASGSVV